MQKICKLFSKMTTKWTIFLRMFHLYVFVERGIDIHGRLSVIFTKGDIFHDCLFVCLFFFVCFLWRCTNLIWLWGLLWIERVCSLGANFLFRIDPWKWERKIFFDSCYLTCVTIPLNSARSFS